MNTAALQAHKWRTALPSLIAGMVCLLPVIGVLAPRALSFVPGLMGLVGVLALHYGAGAAWPRLPRFYGVLCAGITGLAAVSALWSFEPGFALERSVKIALILFPGLLLWGLLDNLDASGTVRLKKYFPLAVLLAGFMAVIYLYAYSAVFYAAHWGLSAKPNLSFLNRGVVVFAFLFFPAWRMVDLADFSAQHRKILKTLFLLILLLVMVITHSQSAQIVMLIGAVVWWLFPWRRRRAWLGLKGLVMGLALLLPFLASLAFQYLALPINGLPWLSQAYAAPRLEIWDFVARKALENPLYGFGIEATRHIENFDTALLFTPSEQVLHPHNAILQIWIEFGLLGIVPFCAFIWALIHHISKLEDSNARFCVGIFCAALAAACTSYGLWQGWWLGLFIVLAAFCRFLIRPETRTAGG